MRRAAVTLTALALLAGGATARAAETLAVAVVVEGEAATSDSLTEIAIAHLAETRGGLVGLRELRGRVPAAPDGGTLEACLARGGCLAELGRAAGAQRVLVGMLTPLPETSWRLDLSLADAATGAVTQTAHRTLPREPSSLADGLRSAIDELLPPPAPPPNLGAPPPAAAPAGTLIETPRQARAEPVSRATIAGLSLAGLAAASFVTAAVLGSVAGAMPEGQTRAKAQADLAHRETLATAANGLLIAGSVLGAASAGFLIWRWR